MLRKAFHAVWSCGQRGSTRGAKTLLMRALCLELDSHRAGKAPRGQVVGANRLLDLLAAKHTPHTKGVGSFTRSRLVEALLAVSQSQVQASERPDHRRRIATRAPRAGRALDPLDGIGNRRDGRLAMFPEIGGLREDAVRP